MPPVLLPAAARAPPGSRPGRKTRAALLAGPVPLQHFPVVGLVDGNDLRVAELLVRRAAGSLREPSMQRLVAEQPDCRRRHAVEVRRIVEEAADAILDDLR